MEKRGVHLSDEKVAEVKESLRRTGVAAITARKTGVNRNTVQSIAREMREAGELGVVVTSKLKHAEAAKAEGLAVDEPYSDHVLWEAYELVTRYGTVGIAARQEGLSDTTLRRKYNRFVQKAERGDFGTEPVIPTFRVSQTTAVLDADGNLEREFIQQKPARGDQFEVPDGQVIKGVSALVDSEGREIIKWIKTKEDDGQLAAFREMVDELKADLPRITPTKGPDHGSADLLNLFPLLDAHLGMMAWREETLDADYDIKIAERLILDWFSAAIAMSPNAGTAVFAQLGDLLHYDSLESVTPTHHHVLDADSRFSKMVRVAIRLVRQIISMLLDKHQRVHVVMASANHDPASSAWLREMLAVMYEDEPRLSVDNSPSEYYAYEFGQTALFFHHGHKRKAENIDSVFAAMFREMFGRCAHSYSHTGHLHEDGVVETNLMRNERHRTLAPKDAYAAGGGWRSKRDAKVITYHKEFGEVSRITLSPQMVQGWSAAA